MSAYAASDCLTFRREDTWSTVFRWKTPDRPAGLEAGCSAQFLMHPLDGGDAVLDISTDSGELVIDDVEDAVLMTVPPSANKAILLGKYVAFQRMTWPDGFVLSTETFTVTVVG